MIRRAPAFALTLVTLACASSRRGIDPVAPAPASQPSATPTATPPAPAPQQASASRPIDVPSPRPAPDSAPSVVSSTDVNTRMTALFGDSAKTSVAPSESTAAAPVWDIEVHAYESTARVERYLRMFTGSAKEHIESRLEHGTRYEPMIRSKFRDGGLPEDLYYLALVESGFDPNAYSRAAAVGMWQFMTSTGRDMGLRVDWWIDERRDPVKSTGAAVRFIKGLRDQFGSLYLAAAAYNGGPGRIARGLTRYADDLEGTSGEDLFFALAEKDYLRNETREYVPQLIAAALIAKEPSRYGMTITPQPPFVYDSVRVGAGTPLAAVAHATGATVSQLQELNPQILRGMTPPRDSVLVRIPDGSADGFAIAFAALPKSDKIATFTVESKKGQSLESIARKNGISARQLSAFNPKVRILKSGNLAPGQTLLVPTVAVASAATLVPDPSIERYGSSRTALHVVRSGETLGGIAKKYHTTTAALMRSNGLRRALIFPGQSLVVRGEAPKRPSKQLAAKPSSKRDATPALMTVAVVKPKTTAKAPAKKTGKQTVSATTKPAKKKSGAHSK